CSARITAASFPLPPGFDSLSSFHFPLSRSLPEPIQHRALTGAGVPYDSFGTRTAHSLPRKSLFFVIFIQYSRAFSLLSVKNPTPPDLRRSSLHESTSCPSMDVRNWLPLTSTCTRYGRLLCIITCRGVSPRAS